MSTIGRFVTDPQGGGFCELDLDSGKRIRLTHQIMASKEGWLTIDVLKFMRTSSDRVFVVNLDSPEGKAALELLTRGVPPENIRATPLGAFVDYLKSCWSVEEVHAKCRVLMGTFEQGRRPHGIP